MEIKEFKGTLKSIPSILSWIEDKLKVLSCYSKALFLSCEEAIVNIIHHGYTKKSAPIIISIENENGRAIVTIIDYAAPFNPLLFTVSIDFSLPLEKRKEGGLGILLMRENADEIFYERKDDKNILIIIKNLSGSQK